MPASPLTSAPIARYRCLGTNQSTFKVLLFLLCFLAQHECTTMSTVISVPSCSACSERNVCIAKNPQEAVLAGVDIINVYVCNWIYTQENPASYSLIFQVAERPPCDEHSASTPLVKILKPDQTCYTRGGFIPCLIEVHFTSTLDWALVSHTSTNYLSAALIGPRATQGNVRIGYVTSEIPTTWPLLTANKREIISACSTSINVNGSRFSRVSGCNRVQLCVANEKGDTCAQFLQQNLFLTSVICSGSACSGKISLESHFGCSAFEEINGVVVSASISASPITRSSQLVPIGIAESPKLQMQNIRGAIIGSSHLFITSDIECTLQQLKLSESGPSMTQSSALEVWNFPQRQHVLTNLTTLHLSKFFERKSYGKKFQLEIYQCGKIFTESFVLQRAETNTSTFDNIGTEYPTQRGATSWAVSTGSIVGLVIVIVAGLGFLADWFYHKSKHSTHADDDRSREEMTATFENVRN